MIDTTHDDIKKIASSSTNVQEFYTGFLQAISSRSNADLGVAWNCTKPPYSPICQVLKNPDKVSRLPLSQDRHTQLLKRVASEGKSQLIAPNPDTEAGPEAAAGAPTILLGPVRRAEKTELVEFILPPTNSSEQNQQALKFLDSSLKFAESFDETIRPADRKLQLSADMIDDYSLAVHQSLDYKKTASAIANETRRILDCDRVSVVLRQGPRFRLFAISGQPSVNRRSNLVSTLEKLVARVLKTGQEFWYPAEDAVPPQVKKPLDNCLSVSSTRSMAIIPIFEKREPKEPSPFEATRARRRNVRRTGRVIGGIVIERAADEWSRSAIEPAVNLVTRHAADAIRRTDQIRRIPLYPVWRTIGQSHLLFSARTLPKTLMALGALALLTLAAIFVPANFDLHCDGVLVPAERRRLFSTVNNGKVEQIFVGDGDRVAQGEPLIQLSSQDLEIQIEDVNTQIRTLETKLAGTNSLRLRQRDTEKQTQQEFVNAMVEQLDGLERVQQKLQQRQRELQLTSPIDGQIVTWEMAERLEGRPVSLNNQLLEVANVDGQWQLELELPDRKVGHLLKAQKESDEPMEVIFQLAMEPDKNMKGRVVKVAGATSVNAEHQQNVRVIVEIDEADIEGLKKVGSGVAAKIRLGRRSLGYVYLYDAIEFVKSKVLFRLW